MLKVRKLFSKWGGGCYPWNSSTGLWFRLSGQTGCMRENHHCKNHEGWKKVFYLPFYPLGLARIKQATY